MTGRDRFLAALHNEKPDRLPCQVHNFMPYFLIKKLLFTPRRAYEYFDMDPVLYINPRYLFNEEDKKKWIKSVKFKFVKGGAVHYEIKYATPEGELKMLCSTDKYTSWVSEPLIKSEEDFELYRKYYPVPVAADWKRVIRARDYVGDRGIVRMVSRGFGQSGAFQSLAYMTDTVNLIYKAYDSPEWVHYALNEINKKNIKTVINSGRIQADLVETGGGAGSSSVIGRDMHREFCLPYDIELHKAIKEQGALISYHLCGAVMPLLEIVSLNGADALETMTPEGMGGDCDLREATSRIGDKMAFIGGLDQGKCFERGDETIVIEEVEKLFRSKPWGGYICSPSDHFFIAKKKNILAFSKFCKECLYQ